MITFGPSNIIALLTSQLGDDVTSELFFNAVPLTDAMARQDASGQ